MKFKIKIFLRSLFQRMGLHLRFTVSSTDLGDFLEMCFPKTPNIPLIRIGGDCDGGYLLPDVKYGFQYLDAVKKVIQEPNDQN